jgi:hypothetical protein
MTSGRMFLSYDGVHVLDSRIGLSGSRGVSNSGKPWKDGQSEHLVLGKEGGRCISYTNDGLSFHLPEHEIGHMMGGRHESHEHWGWFEHTIMGNMGDPTCSGGYSNRRTRTNQWNGCSADDLEYYLEYWHNEKGLF